MANWTEQELDALKSVLAKNSNVRSALEKYCANKSAILQKAACNALVSVPKQIDRASDAAAQSDVFEQFLVTLDKTIEKSFVGPTD